MNNKSKFLGVGFCLIQLTACVSYEESTVYTAYAYDDNQLYSQGYYVPSGGYYTDNSFNQTSQNNVTVPDSYHVGAYHSPVSFKDRDRNWVRNQNPQGYTIEIANGDKASQVAKKLYKAPKGDRRAQVKYLQHGKAYYKGLYGSYSSPQAAQKALESLPDDLKQGAGVKSWGNVQYNLNN